MKPSSVEYLRSPVEEYWTNKFILPADSVSPSPVLLSDHKRRIIQKNFAELNKYYHSTFSQQDKTQDFLSTNAYKARKFYLELLNAICYLAFSNRNLSKARFDSVTFILKYTHQIQFQTDGGFLNPTPAHVDSVFASLLAHLSLLPPFVHFLSMFEFNQKFLVHQCRLCTTFAPFPA